MSSTAPERTASRPDRDHALFRSKRLRRLEAGPSIGYGSRRRKDRVLVAIFPPSSDRFATYIERDGQLTNHNIIEGIGTALEFLGEQEGTNHDH